MTADDEQIVGAIIALVRQDTALAKRVIVADHRVDALQLEIEERAATTIARRQPMAVDLARFWEHYALPTILNGLVTSPKTLPSG